MFQPIETTIKAVCPGFSNHDVAKLPDCAILNRHFSYKNRNQKPLAFISQNSEMPYRKLGYEERIYQHGLIATREHNWHDFFNAMIWHTYPQTKIAINAIHHQQIVTQTSTLRSRQRDLLTLFDECGVIVIANNYILNLIRQHQWQELFVDNRQQWLENKIQIISFGHAMYEKYLNPYIGMTAQALLLQPFDGKIDAYIARQLQSGTLLKSKAELSPLPVLGIPLWYASQTPAFYANTDYFRVARN